jgi:hypothetical protein
MLSQTNLVCIGSIVQPDVVETSISTNLQCLANIIKSARTELIVSSQTEASGSRTRLAQGFFEIDTDYTVSANIESRGTANINMQSVLTSRSTATFSVSLDLTAFSVETVIGEVIGPMPYYTIKVLPESRVLVVDPETGEISVLAESRTTTPDSETRIISVLPESRTIVY